jgi:hypothetical protein
VRVELTWGTNPTIIILPRLADTNRLPYYPRSVHTLFQGLSVVFGLLICYTKSRLTWSTCDLGSSTFCDLRRVTYLLRGKRGKSVAVLGGAPSHTSGLPSYTYIIPHFCGFVKRFLKKIRNFFSVKFATSTCTKPSSSIGSFCFPLHCVLYCTNGRVSVS